MRAAGKGTGKAAGGKVNARPRHVARALAPALLFACLLAGLSNVPTASTQNRARATPRPSRPPQTSQAPAGGVGPYVPPPSDEPPPGPRPKPGGESQPQKAQTGKQDA